MSTISRIVKSTWKQAGKPGSLKSFARIGVRRIDSTFGTPEERAHGRLCAHWFDNKREQRNARASTGHRDVYTRAGVRRSL